MRSYRKTRSILAQTLQLVCVLLLLGVGATGSAQTILPGAQSGTMQEIDSVNESITIAGVRYKFDWRISKIFYAGAEYEFVTLQPGMVLRFTVNREGVVDHIEILGPASMLSDLSQH